MATHPGLAKWHAYMASGGDLTLLSAMIADDAVFHSPVVHTPQAGKAKVMAYLGAAAQVLGGDRVVYVREQRFLARAQPASATVVDLDLSSDSDGSSTFCPVIEFTTEAGEPVRYYGNVCSNPPAYNVGQQVEVVYDPQEITHVQMSGFWSQYTGVVVLTCIGLPFLLITLWGVIPVRKK